MAAPDYVVIGHVVRDIAPEGWTLGGSATFAALQAQRLGRNAAILTSAAADIDLAASLPGVETASLSAASSTTFENTYSHGHRQQRVLSQARELSPVQLPEPWRGSAILHIAPVLSEVPPAFSQMLRGSLIGVSAQGWLRTVDSNGAVQRRRWDGPPFWSNAHVLFVSDEDLNDPDEELSRWTDDVPIVVLTHAQRGARVYAKGQARQIAAFPANDVDPTGAGDIFAAAFLVRYEETSDAATSARFASAAAAGSVEAKGVAGIADRQSIEKRMSEHPEIVLQ